MNRYIQEFSSSKNTFLGTISNGCRNSYVTKFGFTSLEESNFLMDSGFMGFNDFWQIPKSFIEEVNIRRGGWSGVSVVRLSDGARTKTYYVKRQENQLRYALSKPFGKLTYVFEIEAIARNRKLGIPSLNLVCAGYQKGPGVSRGLLVTEAIVCPSLQDISLRNLDWEEYIPSLRLLGKELLRMHELKIQHGALYPKHIFIDKEKSQINLIDFERSRTRRKVTAAICTDLKQLIRRLGDIPPIVIDAIVEPYQAKHSELIKSIKALCSSNGNLRG